MHILPLLIVLGVATGPAAHAQGEPPLAIPAEPSPPPGPPVVVPALPGYAPPAIPVAQDRTWQQGYLDGKLAGQARKTSDWAAAGAVAGCLGSGCGCLAATAVGAAIDPAMPPTYYEGMRGAAALDSDYWGGYRSGYTRTVRTRRATSALVAGAVTSSLVLGVAVAAQLAVVNTSPYPTR